MIAAKEARDLAENYAWSKLHFLNDTFDIIERFSKTGSLFRGTSGANGSYPCE